jgi:hypothetical protein
MRPSICFMAFRLMARSIIPSMRLIWTNSQTATHAIKLKGRLPRLARASPAGRRRCRATSVVGCMPARLDRARREGTKTRSSTACIGKQRLKSGGSSRRSCCKTSIDARRYSSSCALRVSGVVRPLPFLPLARGRTTATRRRGSSDAGDDLRQHVAQIPNRPGAPAVWNWSPFASATSAASALLKLGLWSGRRMSLIETSCCGRCCRC